MLPMPLPSPFAVQCFRKGCSPMSPGRTFHNAHSEDQVTYLGIVALVETREEASENLDAATAYVQELSALGWMRSQTAETARRRLETAREDFVIAVEAAIRIRWSESVGGWYYIDEGELRP